MINPAHFVTIGNTDPVECDALPSVSLDEFRQDLIAEVDRGLRVGALFASPECETQLRLYGVLIDDLAGSIHLTSTVIPLGPFPSLTPDCPSVHLFEREIAEQFGVEPVGHPWLKPVRFHRAYSGRPQPWSTDDATAPVVGVMNFFRVEGDEVHEVAVGPVHAGIIEPGHFRFQCHGEDVFHLEISLGYQHRGIERRLVGGPDKRTVHYFETLAGDTTVGHTLAYCQAVEAISGTRVSPRAQAIRGIALELERLANHVGDLGALAGDVGFLQTAAFCGRIRGDYLNMTATICGSRFGRDLARPGGVLFDLEPAQVSALTARLAEAEKDTASAVNLLWGSPSVMARLEDTGRLTREVAERIGIVGPAARACGISRDIRHDFPSGIFQFRQIPISTWNTGDAFARAYVRWLEVRESIRFVREQLQTLPAGPVMLEPRTLAPNRLVVSLTEGWRGEICHVAITGHDGRFTRYKVIDPSFHNWFALALALRGEQISDFPLCNKSFSLSYSGHDL